MLKITRNILPLTCRYFPVAKYLTLYLFNIFYYMEGKHVFMAHFLNVWKNDLWWFWFCLTCGFFPFFLWQGGGRKVGKGLFLWRKHIKLEQPCWLHFN